MPPLQRSSRARAGASCYCRRHGGSAEALLHAAARHDRDAAAALEHGPLDVREAFDALLLARGAQDVFFVHALDAHALAQRNAIAQNHKRLTFEKPVDAWKRALDERQEDVG